MAAHAGFRLVVVACVAAGAVDGSNRRRGVANCIGRRRTNRTCRPIAGGTAVCCTGPAVCCAGPAVCCSGRAVCCTGPAVCCTGPAGSSSKKTGLALSRWPTGLKPEQRPPRANEYVIAFLHAFELWGQSVTTKGVVHLLPLHQLPQRGGVLHRQPNTTVRHRAAEMTLLIGTVHGVTWIPAFRSSA